VLSSITMRISNLASLVIMYMMPCSLVASQKRSDEVLPPSSGRRTARSRFLSTRLHGVTYQHTEILTLTQITRLGINKLKDVNSVGS